ncbi:Rha family transcriptional regulator [Pseudomonas lurida]|uniref:Rha family transcriptional regulator n=1 Tax=Pseudomonas lurida TaxID=244566 RepID=UPI0017812431|nr:Rha family transcriptional regulator [Pseudomonas lurida]MBD8669003.1 Rha family transcriptional regulator [Pseudomonas lurida]UZQ75439.1 Rha family transcriptional regulator [Pseudomonas lurida]
MNIDQIKAVGHVTTLNGLPVMSSLEIAEITGKNHKHVLRDVRKMLEALKILPNSDLSPQCVETYSQDSYGRLQPMIVLDKELTFTLLSRYSFELSNLIVKRWLELEGSGFERVSVQEAVVHLVEREKDNYRDAMRALRRTPQSRSPAADAHRLEKAEREKESRRIRANRDAAGGQ